MYALTVNRFLTNLFPSVIIIFFLGSFPTVHVLMASVWFQATRTCFLCGSPGHLIRDCPAGSSPHPMLQSGMNSLLCYNIHFLQLVSLEFVQ